MYNKASKVQRASLWMPFWLSLWHFNFSSKKKKNYVQNHSMFILFSKFFSRYSKAQSSRENKKKWNKWTVFWSIKFSSSSYSNLSSSSVVVGRLNKSVKEKNTQRFARNIDHIKNFRFVRTIDLSTSLPANNQLSFYSDWVHRN